MPDTIRKLANDVLDSLHEGCQVIGFDWTYLYLNDAAVAQARQPREHLIGRTMMACYPGIEETAVFGRIGHCMVERSHGRMENVFTFPDGSTRWFELRFVPVSAGTCVLSVDITERKHAEEALQRSESMFRQLYDAAPDAILVVSETGEVLMANAEAERLFGFESGGLVGTSVDDRVPAVHRHRHAAHRADYAANTRVRQMGQGLDLSAVRRDGSEFPVDISLGPFSLKDRPASVCVVRDLTDRRRLEKELRQTEEQFRQAQKMEAVGRLAGGVAHDFNNLLSVIVGYAEMIAAGLPAEDPIRGDVEEIGRAGERGAELTKQLLAFSRQQVLRPKIVDLNQALAGIDKMLRRLIGATIELRTRAAPSLWTVCVDPGQIDQIVMNLAVNARDAMPRGGQLTIETENVMLDERYAAEHVGTTAGPHVMLAVSDTGTGMDAATQAQIFEPFFTTKGAGEGTGLGLSTVFGIVKQSKGSIWVYSEPGLGTTFKLYFPKATDVARTVAPPARPVATRAGNETILVVDDDDPVRRLVREILQRAGYQILAASSPEEALAESGRHAGPIALLLTDIVMPRMNGPELAGRLSAMLSPLKVVYMSGYTGSVAVQSGILGDDDIMIQKPFTPETLLRTLRQVLDGR